VKTAALLALVTGVALSGCAQVGTRSVLCPPCVPNPVAPVVFVSYDKYIVVDQEPIVIAPGNHDPIVWTIPDNIPFTFPDAKEESQVGKGISFKEDPPRANESKKGAIEDQPVFKCSATENPKQYRCTNAHPGPGRYKYTIRVIGNGNKVLELDPWVVNG
jgi:hypothetical protein